MTDKDEKWPFKFGLPFVGAIIERKHNGEKQILLQTRHNPIRDPRYTGTLEFPGGILDHKFESVFDALSREVYEETGLVLKKILSSNEIAQTNTDKDDHQIGFQPYYCLQQLKGDYPWVGFVFLCEVENGELKEQVGETKDPRWYAISAVAKMLDKDQNQFFGLQLPAIKFYIEHYRTNREHRH